METRTLNCVLTFIWWQAILAGNRPLVWLVALNRYQPQHVALFSARQLW